MAAVERKLRVSDVMKPAGAEAVAGGAAESTRAMKVSKGVSAGEKGEILQGKAKGTPAKGSSSAAYGSPAQAFATSGSGAPVPLARAKLPRGGEPHKPVPEVGRTIDVHHYHGKVFDSTKRGKIISLTAGSTMSVKYEGEKNSTTGVDWARVRCLPASARPAVVQFSSHHLLPLP